jgi:hypothetical protein
MEKQKRIEEEQEIAWANASCAADQKQEYSNEPFSSISAYAVNVVDTCREKGLCPERAMEEYLKTVFFNAMR